MTAGSGGGIAIEPNGDAIVLASTLSGNTASANGGAIANAGILSMTTTTIAGNTAQSGPPAFQEGTEGGSVSIWNTILNGAGSGGACGGPVAGVPRRHVRKQPLRRRHVPVHRHRGHAERGLAARSARQQRRPDGYARARQRQPGDQRRRRELCFGTDQRGAAPVGTCDIGAFEFGGRPPEVVLPPPVPGETVNVNRASGIVKIKLPGSDEFFNLRDAQQVPIGSTFDTAKGRVNLVAAANNTGKTQRAWFYEGVFKLAQTKGSKPLTTLKLSGRAELRPVVERDRGGGRRRSAACGATARASSGPRARSARRPCAAPAGSPRTVATGR